MEAESAKKRTECWRQQSNPLSPVNCWRPGFDGTVNEGFGNACSIKLAEIANCRVDIAEMVEVVDRHEAQNYLVNFVKTATPRCQEDVDRSCFCYSCGTTLWSSEERLAILLSSRVPSLPFTQYFPNVRIDFLAKSSFALTVQRNKSEKVRVLGSYRQEAVVQKLWHAMFP